MTPCPGDLVCVDAVCCAPGAQSCLPQQQVLYIKATNADPGDLFGDAVALSADGSTIAIGAPREQSKQRGRD